MDGTKFLKAVKNLLLGVVAQRSWMVKHHKGYHESKWCETEIAKIARAAKTLNDASLAKEYLEKNETVLRYLIPTSNPKRHQELRDLIDISLN